MCEVSPTDLEQVLFCCAIHRPEIDYVQGMSFLARMLLQNSLSPFDSFKVISTMLTTHHFTSALYSLDQSRITAHLSLFEEAFQMCLPQLWIKINTELGIQSQFYALKWLMVMFVTVLSAETCSLVWDRYMCDGEVALIQTALGLILFSSILPQFLPLLLFLSLFSSSSSFSPLPTFSSIKDTFTSTSRWRL